MRGSAGGGARYYRRVVRDVLGSSSLSRMGWNRHAVVQTGKGKSFHAIRKIPGLFASRGIGVTDLLLPQGKDLLGKDSAVKHTGEGAIRSEPLVVALPWLISGRQSPALDKGAELK